MPKCDRFPLDVPLTSCERNANVIVIFMIDIINNSKSQFLKKKSI